MPTHSRRSFMAGLACVAAGATLATSSSRVVAAQGTPAATAAVTTTGWSFVDDRGRTISLESTPTRIFADAMAAMSLWPYGIKPVGISGWLRGYTFPEEWNDVVRFDLEAGELDIEKLIELNPDLSVGITWDTVTKNDFGAVDEATMPGFTNVAPSLCILGVDVPISASIERFGELAAALGASTESESISAARDAFHAASDALRATAAAKPGLTAIAISGALENAWLGNPTVASDLVYFAELGLNVIAPEPPKEFADGVFQQISWEQIGEVQADLYLVDNRPSVMPMAEILEMPVVQLLPAFKANQVADWPVEYITSYDGFTPTLTALAEAVSAAEIVTK